MIIDFFVHPEHSLNSGYPDKHIYDRYISQLDQIEKQSEFPILINGHNAGDFDRKFPLERRIESASYHNGSDPMDRGEVNPKDWDKFVEITQQGSEYRVHGSFFGQCVEGFAVQLFAYLRRKEHWHDWLAEVNEEKRNSERNFRIQHEMKGDFRNCGIKYGVTLSPSTHIEIIKPALIKRWSRLPYGNLTYQLMDINTRVHG